MGISEEDMEKPKIAVINTSNKLSSCFAHVDKISQAVQNAIKAHGGVPFEVRTVASSDFVTSAGKKARYLMQDLEEEGYLVGLEKAKFVERLAHYYCEINVLHPFRVGSGLAQRIFFEQLAIHAGYQLSWQGIEKEAWNQANQNGAMGDLTALQMIFSKVVSEAGESE